MGMTTLQAVNEMLAAIGEPPVTALETGEATAAGWAEDYLDRSRFIVLEAGEWFQSWERDITLEVPDVKIEVSGGSGTFTYDEIVTEDAPSNATGYFRLEDTDPSTNLMYLYTISGTFTGGLGLTGGTSGATRTGATYTAITEGPIGVDRALWLLEFPHTYQGRRVEPVQFARRLDRLYDFDDNTETFDANVRIDRVRFLTIGEMSGPLRRYILMHATVKFQRFMKRGQIDDAFTRDELLEALADARRMDRKYKREDMNLLQLEEIRRVKGSRARYDGPINVFSLSEGG